jgi:hypothetical protein
MSIALTGNLVQGGKVEGALRFDEFSNTVLYIGQAYTGADPADAVWSIQRITFTQPGSDDLDIEWANGRSNFENVWDDRTTLSYS